MGVPTLERQVPYQKIHIKQNATFSMALRIVTRDENDALVTEDTTGWEVYLQVRPEPMRSSPVILEASTANGRIITGIQGTGADEVNIDIKIPHTDTAALEYFGEAGYDLLCVFPGGDQEPYLSGPAVLEPAYTWEEGA